MYTAKNFEHLIGMNGFSDTLLRNHFTLYEGYVNNFNKMLDLFDSGKLVMGTLEYSEIERRFGWEFNGMRLHELYFENLTKEKNNISEGKLLSSILSIFKTFDNFAANFKETGKMRGIGWTVLVKDNQSDELFIEWVDEHNTGHFVDCKILLIMDVFEHAFITDYGIKRADYINAFWENINWKVVEERFEK